MIHLVSGIFGADVITNVADVCASFQYAILRHLAGRLKRALLFCEISELLPSNKKLVRQDCGIIMFY